LFDGFPVKTQTPDSSLASLGIHLMVAFVYSLILSSVSSVPSQCAETKPPFFIAFLNSLKSSTIEVFCFLKSIAF